MLTIVVLVLRVYFAISRSCHGMRSDRPCLCDGTVE